MNQTNTAFGPNDLANETCRCRVIDISDLSLRRNGSPAERLNTMLMRMRMRATPVRVVDRVREVRARVVRPKMMSVEFGRSVGRSVGRSDTVVDVDGRRR